MASTASRRNLGRISEIAQVAVRHGFGYFFETHRLTDLLPGRPKLGPGSGQPLRARPAPARDARRARPDLRQVRPAALDPPRRRPARHRGRAAEAPGRRPPGPVRGRRARHPRGARAERRAALHRVRPDPDRRRLDRPGAPRHAAERPPRRGQGPAPERAEADRGRPRAALPGGPPDQGARAGARVHRPAPARRRVRALDPPGARLPPRGPQRRGLPPPLLGPPARPHPARLLELHAHARADARAARGRPARRPPARRLGDGGAPPPRLPDGRDVDDDDLPPRLLPRRPAPGEHLRDRRRGAHRARRLRPGREADRRGHVEADAALHRRRERAHRRAAAPAGRARRPLPEGARGRVRRRAARDVRALLRRQPRRDRPAAGDPRGVPADLPAQPAPADALRDARQGDRDARRRSASSSTRTSTSSRSPGRTRAA